VLILDEPTAVLTPIEARDLFATLHSMVAQGRSVIFISHHLDEILEFPGHPGGRLAGGQRHRTENQEAEDTRNDESVQMKRPETAADGEIGKVVLDVPTNGGCGVLCRAHD